MSYLYLASPYTHSAAIVRQQRYLEAIDALNWLLGNRIWAYSPIVHCHNVAMKHDLPKDFEFWQEYNHLMILQSRGVMILQCEGWYESRGILDERGFAKLHALPISYMKREGQNYAITRDLSRPDLKHSHLGDDLRPSELPDASEVG